MSLLSMVPLFYVIKCCLKEKCTMTPKGLRWTNREVPFAPPSNTLYPPDVLNRHLWLFPSCRPQRLVWIRRSRLFMYAPHALWASSVTWESHWSEANVWDSCCQWSTETWSKSLIHTGTLQASDTHHHECVPSQPPTSCTLWKVINKHPDVL